LPRYAPTPYAADAHAERHMLPLLDSLLIFDYAFAAADYAFR